MKILVIFTGGTIGSRLSKGWISTDDATSYALLEGYKKLYKNNEIEFETLSPYTVLSENLSVNHLNSLISAVCDNISSGYDGIIVTHGTDTIQYGASAVAFAVGDTLPVVFVSSNKPLDSSDSNGYSNFAAAVDLIKAGLKGVFVAYKNNNGRVYYHRANRLIDHQEAMDDVYSLLNENYGENVGGEVQLNASDRSNGVDGVGSFELLENSGILSVTAYPGDSFNYNLMGVRAVILRPYHSGTLNTESEGFRDFCKKAKTLNIPVFMVNAPKGETYESSKLFDELGIISLPTSAFAAIYIKLWLAISLEENIAEFIKKPINYEFV